MSMTRKHYTMIANGIASEVIALTQLLNRTRETYTKIYNDPEATEEQINLAESDFWKATANHGTAYIIAKNIAGELRADNSRFDEQRFMKACGFEG